MATWGRLSESLPHQRNPETCQACGITALLDESVDLQAWQEHDEQDRREPIIVMLCAACAKKLIKKHPRLYRHLGVFEPFPGCMPICVACVYRDQLDCGHPDLKANGGDGLVLRYSEPDEAIMCGPHCDVVTLWHGQAKCEGRKTIERTSIP